MSFVKLEQKEYFDTKHVMYFEKTDGTFTSKHSASRFLSYFCFGEKDVYNFNVETMFTGHRCLEPRALTASCMSLAPVVISNCVHSILI